MADTKIEGLNFGAAIAFVAPGFLAFKGLSYQSATLQSWLAAAVEKDQGVGVFLFVLLASTALGIGVSGVRALLIDSLFFSRLAFRWKLDRPKVEWDKLDDQKRQALNTLIDGFYRYYQFYSNSLIGLIVLLIGRSSVTPTPPWTIWHWVGLLAVGFSLLWSSHDSFRKYTESLNELFSGATAREAA